MGSKEDDVASALRYCQTLLQLTQDENAPAGTVTSTNLNKAIKDYGKETGSVFSIKNEVNKSKNRTTQSDRMNV